MPDKYYVYILRSEKDGKRYIGSTGDVDKRVLQHQQGEVKSTKQRKPLKLIYIEAFDDKHSAQMRERLFKTGKGRAYLKECNI